MTNPKAHPDADDGDLRNCALRLLARREHSALELRHKLQQRHFADDAIVTVLEELIAQDLLSDARFAEVYAASRMDRGFGPLRIQRDLQERGVDSDIVAATLEHLDDNDWAKQLLRVQQKKFRQLPGDQGQRLQQTRFLRQRGFTLDQINHLFRHP